MFRISCLFGLLISLYSTVPAFAEDASIAGTGSSPDSFCWVEQLDKDLQYMVSPIGSEEQLAAYLKSESTTTSPLNFFSPRGKRIFLEGLTFNEKGLTGLRLDILQKELTPTQIYRVLALFGEQSLTNSMKGARIETELDRQIMDSRDGSTCPSGDKYYYRCDSRASCKADASSICKARC